MDAKTYDARVRRRRGVWEVRAPGLPADAPVVRVAQLDNAAPELIEALAGYLGVDPSTLAVRVPHPVRTPRVPLRARLSAGAAQLTGGGVLLAGIYTAGGAAATLIAAGVGVVAVATGKEAGWL